MGVSRGEQFFQDASTDAAALGVGMDVEVFEAQALGDGAERVEADGDAVAEDAVRVRGVERVSEALAGADRVEATEVFEAGAHCGDTELGEGLEVGGGDGGEGQARFVFRPVHAEGGGEQNFVEATKRRVATGRRRRGGCRRRRLRGKN